MDLNSIRKIAKSWEKKSPEWLREAAVLEDTGSAFDAVRVAGGRRICLAVCATGEDQIRVLREAWGLTAAEASGDWLSLNAGDLVARAADAPGGWAFAALGGGDEWLALYLVGVAPDSIRILELGFGLEAS